MDNCLRLDGATRVDVDSLMGSPKNVTLSAWANLTVPDTAGAEIVSVGDYFAIRLDNGTTSRAFFYNGTTWVTVSVNQTFAGAGWHHFAAVFNDDQNYCKLFIDGVEAASLSTTVTIPYTGLGTKTVVGRHGNGMTTYDFTGKIDDVRVYNRCLCPSEIQALHDLGGNTFGGVKIIKWVEIQ
ncbi:MAG: LamG domain-containing protein, partial [Pirellulales bacterium]